MSSVIGTTSFTTLSLQTDIACMSSIIGTTSFTTLSLQIHCQISL